MTHPAPFDEDIDEFLCPGEGDLDIDNIFAKDFDSMLDDYRQYAPEDIVPNGEVTFPSLINPDLHFREVPCGIILFDDDRAIGGYLGCDIALYDEYQGQGLGKEIIIERCLREGSSPVWHLDEAAYSEAGLAAHRAAWHHARENPAETETRLNRIETQQTSL